MPKRSTHPRQGTDAPPPPAPPESRYHIEHYGKSRYFAVYEGKALLALTVYRKGAQAILQRIQADDQTIADQQRQIDAIAARFREQPTVTSPLLAESLPAPVWRPPQQLPLIAESLKPYRATSPRRSPNP